jgi:hypothetical protein
MNRHFRYTSLENIGISQARYYELIGFAGQYGEWNDALKSGINTEKINNIQLINDVADNASIQTIGNTQLSKYVLKNVAEGRSFYYLRDVMRMPFSDRTFWKVRKNFFLILNEVKK